MNQYSLWRYIALIAVIVVSIIYAVPNFFGEDPAIQITTKSGVPLTPELKTNVVNALHNSNLNFKSVTPETNALLIRFNNTDTQLSAQDVIKGTVGDQYSVALNLAPRTPAWLEAIGAHPMKLGLDLRGGIHFLLDIDVDNLLKARLQSTMHTMGDQLRDAGVRYSGMDVRKDGIAISFRDIDSLNKAQSTLSGNFPEYQLNSNTKNNQFKLQAEMTPQAMQQVQQYAIQQNQVTLTKRVNELGVAEAVVQQVGVNQISIDLPGVQDTARAKDMIGKVATLRFQLVDDQHDAVTAAKTGVVPFGDQLFYYEGQPLLLKNQVILRGDDIVNAQAQMSEDGRPAVSVRLGSGIAYFNRITGENVGKRLGVIYVETEPKTTMVDGKPVRTHVQKETLISAATIQTALPANFQITGLESTTYAKNLALQLRSGSLTTPVDFVQERLVGPSLGAANIHKGVMSTVVGSLLVILFMALYYRGFGLIADMALILNVVILVAIMSIVGFTMTLPGIAGVVLTVGMAVDANVLINERIREELRAGQSPQAAIYAGYERAFSTIVDSNVTTLIVAVILMALGSGSVKGFAVSLTIGLLASMFTAIFATRAVVNFVYGRRSQLKSISIGINVKSKKI